jgi:hypothetical protein
MTGEEASPDTQIGKLLADHAEILYRQVHPNWVEDGVPSYLAFRPTTKDEGQLSVDQGSLITAEDAYRQHTTIRKLKSAGTWAVTVGEADGAALKSFDDHEDDPPAHGFIDFRGLGKREAQRNAAILAARAHKRGRLYPTSRTGEPSVGNDQENLG